VVAPPAPPVPVATPPVPVVPPVVRAPPVPVVVPVDLPLQAPPKNAVAANVNVATVPNDRLSIARVDCA
jgi:hypothetical protein